MKRTTYTVFIILALCTAIALAVGQAQFTTASESSISITGSSTLHEWKMQGPTIRGTITLDEALAADLTPKTWSETANLAAATVVIPVASIRSEHARMDKLMQEALKAKAHPEINYRLESAAIEKANGDSFTLRTQGKLTIAGSTRGIEMMINGIRTPNTYILSSEVPIRMTDYGIKPPTAMMGTVKTGDDVKVSFRWTVGRSH